MGALLALAVLIAVPATEIWVMIRVGGVLGAGWTVLAVFATAVVGVFLVRLQGLSTIARIQAGAREGEIPADEVLAGAALLVAGLLLIVPGFVSDALGFALLVPPVRRLLARRLLLRAVIVHAGRTGRGRQARRPGAIEGEYRRVDDGRDGP